MRETEFAIKKIHLGAIELFYNLDTLIFTGIIMFVIILLFFWLKQGLQFLPGRKQIVLESIFEYFDGVLEESLGQDGRKFLGFIVTLFTFVLLSNWMGIIPGCLSPTRDLNVCLGLALVVLVIAHGNAIKVKGLKKYISAYFQPYWWLFVSNVFSEISKALSHSFRLFGNIFAGGIVVALIPALIIKLLSFWGIPLVIVTSPLIKAFFGIFLGGIQAYVFTVLAIAYMSVLAQD